MVVWYRHSSGTGTMHVKKLGRILEVLVLFTLVSVDKVKNQKLDPVPPLN